MNKKSLAHFELTGILREFGYRALGPAKPGQTPLGT